METGRLDAKGDLPKVTQLLELTTPAAHSQQPLTAPVRRALSHGFSLSALAAPRDAGFFYFTDEEPGWRRGLPSQQPITLIQSPGFHRGMRCMNPKA